MISMAAASCSVYLSWSGLVVGVRARVGVRGRGYLVVDALLDGEELGLKVLAPLAHLVRIRVRGRVRGQG